MALAPTGLGQHTLGKTRHCLAFFLLVGLEQLLPATSSCCREAPSTPCRPRLAGLPPEPAQCQGENGSLFSGREAIVLPVLLLESDVNLSFFSSLADVG